MGTSATDHADIQAIVKGFGYRYPVARYSMLRLADSAEVNQRFLQSLPEALDIAEIPTSIAALASSNSVSPDSASPNSAITVGLSFAGLAKLGVSPSTLRSFPLEFCQGMAARSALNSDTGPSAPHLWEPFWTDGVDVVLGIVAGSVEAAEQTHQRLRAFIDNTANERGEIVDHIQEVGTDHGQRIFGPEQGGHPRPIEHFGFRDGVSTTPIEGLIDGDSPKIKGAGRLDHAGDWHAIAAGEFLYGYTDEIGEIPTGPQPSSIARNGTYLVYRKLQQNVDVFHRYVQQLADDLDLDADTVAAKIVGRKHDGQPLVTTNGINDFDYSADPRGRQCPLGSHVRRTNPRDSLGFQSLLVDRHRMARRGITYGQPFDGPDSGDRGLLFLALNVDIGRQFEFVQREWVNFGNDFDQGADRDPLTGSHEPDLGEMTFHYDKANPVVTAKALPRFVDTRGGEYFFVPGCDGYRRVIEGSFGPTS